MRAEKEGLARAEVVRRDVPRQRRVTAEEVAVRVEHDEEGRAWVMIMISLFSCVIDNE